MFKSLQRVSSNRMEGGTMFKKIIIVSSLLFIAWVLFPPTNGNAMPNFAREYGADCTMCHTNIPKLNRTGYEFRLAGYRLPSEIGKEEKPFNLGDFFAARFQDQFRYAVSKPAVGEKSTTNQLEFLEFTMYPLTGSWGRNFASIGELSMAPDDVFEFENAYVRGAYGNDAGWFQAKVGIMHPWEGFGASDRPIGTVRPLFQRQKTAASPFVLWNLDESAVEVGYHIGASGTSIAGRLSNGIMWKGDQSGNAEPAQGGALSKTENGNTLGVDRKNYQFFLNQFFARESAVTLYYYRGVIPFVDTSLDTISGNTLETFTRYAAYANFWVVPSKVNLLAGYAMGKDSPDDGTLVATGVTEDGTVRTFNAANAGKSKGAFGEVDFHASPKVAFAGRYDTFDPSDKTGRDKLTAETVSANWYIVSGLQLIADYQHKDTEKTAGKTKDDLYQARMIFIW